LHHNTALFRELEDLLQQGYADYQSGQQHLEPYAVPKRQLISTAIKTLKNIYLGGNYE
jgi:hypothetical protein